MRPTTKALLIFSLSVSQLYATLPKWSYDTGPDLNTKMGKELIDLTAAIPDMPEISKKVMGYQKFRPAFGPIPWRMTQKPNSVKILFIGQDGTHIAEAAGRPATAGFGGRAQDLARYFGVNEGAAFINTYAFTIRGQYGAYQSPMVYEQGGEYKPTYSSLVDNGLWAITQDLDSPIAKWRNDLIDWIIRNNKDSIKLIVNFGGAARDAIATFARSKGAEVKAKKESTIDRYQIPETKLKYAGGNNQFPALINKKGYDLYSDMLGEKLDYTKTSHQEAAINDFKENIQDYLENAIFTQGGPHQNGILHAAQLGGFNLDKISFDGETFTRSLKGITLNDGTKLENDVLVVSLPHPSYLSRLSKHEASAQVGNNLKALKKYVEAGWEIPADEDQENKFAAGKPYVYSRADIGPEYYDFGTPGTRMVPVSTASRMSGKKHIIVFGTRDRAKFDKAKLDEMTFAKPSTQFSDKEMFTARPRTKELRYIFDAGPGLEYARMMKENLDLKKIFKTKEGMSFKNDGITAYNVKNHPEVADFGHYRGTFQNPRVLILADPDGYDDLITARALTGTRGQYLHGLMENAGVQDNYLVIKTVPFGMDGATKDEYAKVLADTKEYREKILNKVLSENKIELIIADGKYARSEIKKIKSVGATPIVEIRRKGTANSYGIKAATNRIKKIPGFENTQYKVEMRDIPRSHLSFYARIWEGTSGDRVLNSQGKHQGLGFAEVAPQWAWGQKTTLAGDDSKGSKALNEKLESFDLPTANESLSNFLDRLGIPEGLNKITKFIDSIAS